MTETDPQIPMLTDIGVLFFWLDTWMKVLSFICIVLSHMINLIIVKDEYNIFYTHS